MTLTLTPKIIQAAIQGLEDRKKAINAQLQQLRASMNGPTPASEPTKRSFSPAVRRRMAAAQKKRWAEKREAEKQALNGSKKPGKQQ